jgi:hypothetical protein
VVRIKPRRFVIVEHLMHNEAPIDGRQGQGLEAHHRLFTAG